MNDTICSIATTLGVGAISIIRVSGNEALKIVSKIFSKNLVDVSTHTIHYGYIKNKEEIIGNEYQSINYDQFNGVLVLEKSKKFGVANIERKSYCTTSI